MEQNLSGYKIFYEVANCGNISKAAKELYISQPAISKSIVKLEESLGVRLFNRNSRGVTLTDEGAVLYEHICKAFESINQAEGEIRRIKEFNIGHLRIGVSSTLCKNVLLPYLKEYLIKYPNTRISIETMATAKTLQALEEKKLDFGLVARPQQMRSDLAFLKVMDIHDIFAATPAYLQNQKMVYGEEKNLFETANILLLDRSNMTRRHVDEYFKENGIEPVQTLEVTSLDLLEEFVRTGIGVGALIREFVSRDIEAGDLIEIETGAKIPQRTIGFAYNTSACSKSLKCFLEIAQQRIVAANIN